MTVLLGLCAMGGPAALIAWRRGRNPAGWLLLGILAACVGISVFPKESRRSPLLVFPVLALTPTVLFLLPKGARARKPKAEEPQDWSSAAPLELGRAPGTPHSPASDREPTPPPSASSPAVPPSAPAPGGRPIQ